MHGNNKSVAELAAALDAGVGKIVVDSFAEVARLDDLARRRDVTADVMIRVTVGVEAHTHEFIATAHEDQKFGFSLAGGDAAEAVRRVLKSRGLRLVGLHSHIGSQIFDSGGFELAARRVVGLLAEVRAEHGDLAATAQRPRSTSAAGWASPTPRPTSPGRPPGSPASCARSSTASATRAGIPVPRIAVEPGRAIAGPGTVTLYTVGTIKDVELGGGARRRYVSVDGGMSDNIRTALYDAAYDCRLVSRSAEGVRAPPTRAATGPPCAAWSASTASRGDVVVRDCWLPADLAPGDLLAVGATGAYCYAMASALQQGPPTRAWSPCATAPTARCCAARPSTTWRAWRCCEQPDPEWPCSAAGWSAPRWCGCSPSRPTSSPPASAPRSSWPASPSAARSATPRCRPSC